MPTGMRDRNVRCTTRRMARLVVLAVALFPGGAAARQGMSSQLRGELSLGSTYYTNVEHKPTGAETVGLELGGRARLQLTTGAFAANLQHDVSVHRYRVLPDRDRTSHASRLTIDLTASDAVAFRTTAIVSFAGLSEDREVGTEYAVTEAMDVRFDARNRVRFSSGYSKRRYGERSGRNASNWSLGAEYTVGGQDKAALFLASKYDWNVTDEPKSEFRRWTHRVAFRAPLPGSELAVGISRITREYPYRLVELEEVRDLDLGEVESDVLDDYVRETGTPRASIPVAEVLSAFPPRWRDLPRRDEIWSSSAGLTVMPGRTLEIELAYEFEARLSTDLRRGYSGHTLALISRVSL